MKQGKKPTAAQRDFIAERGLNAREWMVSKDTPTVLVIVNRYSPTSVREIPK